MESIHIRRGQAEFAHIKQRLLRYVIAGEPQIIHIRRLTATNEFIRPWYIDLTQTEKWTNKKIRTNSCNDQSTAWKWEQNEQYSIPFIRFIRQMTSGSIAKAIGWQVRFSTRIATYSFTQPHRISFREFANSRWLNGEYDSVWSWIEMRSRDCVYKCQQNTCVADEVCCFHQIPIVINIALHLLLLLNVFAQAQTACNFGNYVNARLLNQ